MTEASFDALLAVALNEPDGAWVQERCLHLLDSPEPQLRALAATCLGHLARLHPGLDHARSLAALEAVRDDPETAGQAADAIEDIALFARPRDSQRPQ